MGWESQKFDRPDRGTLLMDIRQLRCFFYVADLGSATQASAFLHVTQPAISRTIKALEDELGVALFERNGRGVRLTDAGIHLKERAHQIFQIVEDTKKEVVSFAGTVSGDVMLGVPPSFFAVTPGLLAHCRRVYPLINVRLLEGFNGYLQEWLLSGAVDLAILNSRASDLSRYKVAHVAKDRLYIIGNRREREDIRVDQIAEELPFQSLAGLPVILPTRSSALRKLIEEAATKAAIEIRPVHELDSIAAIKELVLRGEGVAVLPRANISRELEAGDFWAARLTRPEVQRELVVATLIDRPAGKAARVVQDIISNELKAIARSTGHQLGFF